MQGVHYVPEVIIPGPASLGGSLHWVVRAPGCLVPLLLAYLARCLIGCVE